MKYKVGDHPVVREDLGVRQSYGNVTVHRGTRGCRGIVHTAAVLGVRGLLGQAWKDRRARLRRHSGVEILPVLREGDCGMRIYISGAISGTTDYMERFAAAEEKLKAQGHEVVNPAKVTESLPKSFTWKQYMRVALSAMAPCDAIYMLKGWEHSRGATIEYTQMIWSNRMVACEGEDEL